MAFEVLFSDKQKEELGSQVYSVVTDAVQKARFDAGMDKKFLNKKETCEYLGVSNNTFDKYFVGLKTHDVNGLLVYSKKEIDEFVFNK
ncbi:DNA-binding protein [Companilactobacillus musae]|uniref:DNA-binding protein n=1 Tax=Companilactobacillus musae TaxID=1903258 RepID=UPI00342239E2